MKYSYCKPVEFAHDLPYMKKDIWCERRCCKDQEYGMCRKDWYKPNPACGCQRIEKEGPRSHKHYDPNPCPPQDRPVYACGCRYVCVCKPSCPPKPCRPEPKPCMPACRKHPCGCKPACPPKPCKPCEPKRSACFDGSFATTEWIEARALQAIDNVFGCDVVKSVVEIKPIVTIESRCFRKPKPCGCPARCYCR